MPLFADPNAAHKPLAEYLMQAPEHASLDAMVQVVSRLDGGYAAEYLKSALDEALVSYAASSMCFAINKRRSPDALCDAIESLGSLISADGDRLSPEERFGTDIRALLLIVRAGLFERLVALFDAAHRFCYDDAPADMPMKAADAADAPPSQQPSQQPPQRREAQFALDTLHTSFDTAARDALLLAPSTNAARAALLSDGHPPRSSALIQHASLQLCLLHEELGHTAEALLAAHEAVLVAHQQGDAGVLRQAIDALRRLEAADAPSVRADDDWDLVGYASLAVLLRKDDASAVAYARASRGAEVDRLVGAKPAKDAAAALRWLAAAGEAPLTAAVLAHRTACLLGDLPAADRIAQLSGASGVDADVIRGRVADVDSSSPLGQLLLARAFAGRGRGAQQALRAWSEAHEKGWETVEAVAQLSLAATKLRAGRADDALKLVLEVAPHVAAHASLLHQAEALLLEAKCRLALGGNAPLAALPLLGEAARKAQEACAADAWVEALYLSARALHACGRTAERDKVAARWLAARRKLQRATRLDVAAGDALRGSGLDALVEAAAHAGL